MDGLIGMLGGLQGGFSAGANILKAERENKAAASLEEVKADIAQKRAEALTMLKSELDGKNADKEWARGADERKQKGRLTDAQIRQADSASSVHRAEAETKAQEKKLANDPNYTKKTKNVLDDMGKVVATETYWEKINSKPQSGGSKGIPDITKYMK